jgi:hypothetical protein
MAKKEQMPVMEQKPGRYWGVIGRRHLPLGKREDREATASEAVKLRRVMRRYRVANTPPEKRKYLRKSQLWSEDFTAKLFCNVEFWLERIQVDRASPGIGAANCGRAKAIASPRASTAVACPS